MKQALIILCLLGASFVATQDCTDCFFPSSGPCKGSNTVCYDYYADGTCPTGTTACGNPPTTYACDSSAGSCALSSTGTYASQSACQSACQAPSKYACNSQAYTCSESSSGSYASMSACQSACVAPPAKYACDSSSYTCSESSSGSYDSQSACSSACVAPGTKYSCDTSSYTCSASQSGSYDTSSACSDACQAPVVKYACDTSSYTCSQSGSGAYDSMNSCKLSCKQGQTGNFITNYIMINNLAALQEFLDQMNAVDKLNFNRVVLSFLQPSIHSYQTGNLACTGFLGYYCDNWATETVHLEHAKQSTDGKADFITLKNAIAEMKSHNLEVRTSVGGWDFNCREDIYCETLKYYNKSTAIVCDPAVNYSYVCEPKGQPQKFDYFPDPLDTDWADAAYKNIVELTVDLGADGLDLDYEEFWHADYYRRDWKQEDFIGAVREQSWKNTTEGVSGQEKMQYYFDSLTFTEKINQFAASSPNNNPSATGPFVLPDTVDKLWRIMQSLEKASNNRIYFSFAGPAVGALPIMVPQYGDANSLEYGGVWWGGNLKGLLYSLTDKYGVAPFTNWDIGLMTYDLGCKSGNDCGSGLPFGCTLVEQVEFYAGSYITYMKNSNAENRLENIVGDGDPMKVKPHYYNIPGLKTQFGFEVGHPAYPAYDDSWKKMICLEPDVGALFNSLGDQHEGIIIWEMFKPTSGTWPNEASTKFIDQAACTFYNLGADYNCGADVPNPFTAPTEYSVEQ